MAHDNVKSSWGVKTKESNFSPLRHLMVYGAWVEWQISKRIMLQNDSQLVLNIRIFVNRPQSTSLPVMIVKDYAWFLSALFCPSHNFISQVGRHLAFWDPVAKDDLVP